MLNISSRQFAAIKRIAQNLYPTASRINKINKMLNNLQKEKDYLQNIISSSEASVMSITDNHPVLDIVNRVVETTTNSNGESTKITKWVPSNLVTKNEDGTYTIVDEPIVEVPTATLEEEVTPEELEDVSDRYFDARGMQTEVTE